MNAEQPVQVHQKQELGGQERTRPGRTYVPDVDIWETADALWLWADMPGVTEQSVTVDVSDGVLSVEGQVGLEEYKGLTPVYTEYNIGNYMRRFTLSNDIDVERIKAQMHHGVLELELPKSARAKPRRIAVTTS